MIETNKNIIFEYTPNDYSPTYILESDGNRNLIKIVSIHTLPTDYPDSSEIPIKQHHIEYFQGSGWKRVLEFRDWLNLKT